jgi:hypothetical protein
MDELNMHKSKQYKRDKYRDSSRLLQIPSHLIKLFAVEVSTLGFSSDISKFPLVAKLHKMPKSILASIANIALNHSYDIYRSRKSVYLKKSKVNLTCKRIHEYRVPPIISWLTDTINRIFLHITAAFMTLFCFHQI